MPFFPSDLHCSASPQVPAGSHSGFGISHAMVMEATALVSAWDISIRFNFTSLESLATPSAESWGTDGEVEQDL